MKKSLLNTDQQETYHRFNLILQQSGWAIDGGLKTLFDADIEVEPEAAYTLTHGNLSTTLSISLKKGFLYHDMVGETSFQSHLILYYKDIDHLLEYISSEQQSLSLETYPAFVKHLTSLCKLALYVSEDETYRISSDPE